jgi:uncharacterized protein
VGRLDEIVGIVRIVPFVRFVERIWWRPIGRRRSERAMVANGGSLLARRLVEAGLVLCLFVSAAAAQTFPKPVGRINDFAGVLDPAAEQELDTLLDTLEKDTTSEVAVVTVDSLDRIPVEEYANTLFNAWGIGQRGKDNGVLVLVAPSERQMRIEVGYGLEGVLPDGLAGSIIREDFTPAFREGQYQSGILNGVRRISGVIRRNEKLTAEQLNAIERAVSRPRTYTLPGWTLIAFLGLFVSFGAYIAGIGVGAKIITWSFFGLAFAGVVYAVSSNLAWVTALGQLPFAAGAFYVGLRRTKSPSFVSSIRGKQKSTGWAIRSTARASSGYGGSSRSGGSSSFGGGRSGGGGASGRW